MAWPCLESNLRESSRVGPSYCTIYIGYQGHEVILDPCLDGMKGFQGNGEVVTVLMVGMYDRFIQMMPVTRTLGPWVRTYRTVVVMPSRKSIFELSDPICKKSYESIPHSSLLFLFLLQRNTRMHA